MSEHGMRYEHVARYFVDRGWNVLVPDQRGHGRSGGVPTHISRFQQYCEDLEKIRLHFKLVPEQTAILAHSMGGLVSIRYCQTYSNHIKAMVLSSPLLGVRVKVPFLTLLIGKILSYVYPLKRFKSRVDQCYTTRNEEKLRERENDPLAHQSITAGWFFSMQEALKEAWDNAALINIPTLIVQAGDDYIVDPHVPEDWLSQTSATDKEFIFLDEHYHEVLNELDWKSTVKTMEEWLNVRIGLNSSDLDDPDLLESPSGVEPLVN